MSSSRATLIARKPFSSFIIPGSDPSVVVDRRGALLDAETTTLLKKALKAGKVPNLKPEDVEIVDVDAPTTAAGAASGSSTGDSAELAKEVEALTEERDEAAQAAKGFKDERDALAKEVEALKGAASESDSVKLASGILDSLTVPQLTDLAKARKVEHDAKASKADIIAAIVAPVPAE